MRLSVEYGLLIPIASNSLISRPTSLRSNSSPPRSVGAIVTLSISVIFSKGNPRVYLFHLYLARCSQIGSQTMSLNIGERVWKDFFKCKLLCIFMTSTSDRFRVAGHPLLQTGSKVLCAFIQDPQWDKVNSLRANEPCLLFCRISGARLSVRFVLWNVGLWVYHCCIGDFSNHGIGVLYGSNSIRRGFHNMLVQLLVTSCTDDINALCCTKRSSYKPL